MSAPTKSYTDAEVATMRASAFMSGAAWADRRGMVSLAEIENEANRRYPQSMFAASSSVAPLSETPRHIHDEPGECAVCGYVWPSAPCSSSVAPLSETPKDSRDGDVRNEIDAMSRSAAASFLAFEDALPSVAPLSETPSEGTCEHCGNPLSLHPMRWERKSKPGTFLTCDASLAPLSEPTSEERARRALAEIRRWEAEYRDAIRDQLGESQRQAFLEAFPPETETPRP